MRRNTFGDENEQFDAGVQCFVSGIKSQVRRHEDNRAGGAGGFFGLGNGVEYRHAVDFFAAFAGCNAGYDFCAVVKHALGVGSSHLTGSALHYDFCIFVDKNHF
ncbi:MAG: hypothetical protein BWY75_03708 [bacterium ADurb.Bin425]|nr:MAG: hypothetical protein BWY75_03708 [bacterium ADurb.Bin425]